MKTAFNVEINTTQWCTCSDFTKNGHQEFCKHILLIVLHVLNGKDLEPFLRISFLEENDLQSLFDATGKDIKHQFLSEQPTGERKDFHAMPFMTCRTHLFYSKANLEKAKRSTSGWQNVQTVVAEWLLMLKTTVLSMKVL